MMGGLFLLSIKMTDFVDFITDYVKYIAIIVNGYIIFLGRVE